MPAGARAASTDNVSVNVNGSLQRSMLITLLPARRVGPAHLPTAAGHRCPDLSYTWAVYSREQISRSSDCLGLIRLPLLQCVHAELVWDLPHLRHETLSICVVGADSAGGRNDPKPPSRPPMSRQQSLLIIFYVRKLEFRHEQTLPRSKLSPTMPKTD